MQRTWVRHYPAGVPEDITLSPDATLLSMFDDACSRFAQRPAFHSLGHTIDYEELELRSRQFAACLQALGLKAGERISLMMPNLLQYPIAMFGALRAGLVVVNTNPLYTPRELEHQLRDSEAAAIVILANFAHVLERVLPRVGVRVVITTEVGDLLPLPRRVVTNWAVRKIKKAVPEYHIAGSIRLLEALDRGAKSQWQRPATKSDDLAFLQYTGGTTGVAKGAMLTHANLCANLEQVATVWRSYIKDGEEIVITALPLYHIFCLTCNCLTFMKHGGLNVLIVNPRDTPAFIAELSHWPFTFISGVNTLYRSLLDHPRFARLNLSRLKLGIAGGMALQSSVAERWQALAGQPLVEGYGLTEASPVVACNLPTARRLGTVGVPLPSTDISIRDGDRELSQGEVGELCVRGPQIMKGYWHNEAETKRTISEDGWLHTGDIAVLESDGFLRIVDRQKDMIIVSGFKVFPNEVEEVISMHSAVVEVGCVGVPDERSGQAVKAFVVARETSLTQEQLWHHCREHLTAYKVPRYIEFRDSLPKTNIGKVLRRALLEESSANHDTSSAVPH